MTDRIRTLRVVRPEERASAPRTEHEILAEMCGHMAELARLAGEWQSWAQQRLTGT